jgi:hypothetical protein
VKCKILNGLKESIIQKIGFYIYLGDNIYSMGMDADIS